MLWLSIPLVAVVAVYVYLVARCCWAFRFSGDGGFHADTTLPQADIIVAAKNEEANVGALADSLRNQTHDKTRLIFVDDHSTDSTAEAIMRNPLPDMLLLRNPGHGKKDSIRFALQSAQSPYILFTDADCVPSHEWCSNMVSTAESCNADIVMGPVLIEPRDCGSVFQRLWQTESFALITITGGSCMYGHPVMCNGGNIGYRGDFIRSSVGDIKPRYASGDDMFMMESAQRQRRRFAYCRSTKSLVRTMGPDSIGGLLRQRARWVSKTGGYTDWYILFFAFMILLGNLSAIAASVFLLMEAVPWYLALGALAAKFAVDYVSVMVSSRFYGVDLKLLDVLLLELVYPYYVLASIVTYAVRGVRWK